MAGHESRAEYVNNRGADGMAVVADMHGTRRCYQRSCRCLLCKAANTHYGQHVRRLHAYGHPPLGRRIPATATVRRLKHLLTEGLTRAAIARGLGLRDRHLQLHTGPGGWVTLRTALKVARLYRQWAE